MIANECVTLVQCPTCERWREGQPDDLGIVRAYCIKCDIELSFGHEQQLENGTFQGQGKVQTFSDYDSGWIQALIDSEGCLLWNKGNNGKRYPRIDITNTNFLLLARAQRLLGGRISHTGNGSKILACWRLEIAFKDWKLWLNDIPLVEKEIRRQEFLLYQINLNTRKSDVVRER